MAVNAVRIVRQVTLPLLALIAALSAYAQTAAAPAPAQPAPAAMRAWKEGLTFKDEIARDPAITSRLSPEKLAQAFDYTRQLANVDAIFTRVLGE